MWKIHLENEHTFAKETLILGHTFTKARVSLSKSHKCTANEQHRSLFLNTFPA